MVKNINFFTVATGKHRDFVLPYVTSVLFHNPSAFVEILVDDMKYFTADMKVLDKIYPGEYKISLLDGADIKRSQTPFMAASLRFVSVPTMLLEYTYIGDVDILVLQKNIHTLHVDHMKESGVPFSNMVRKNQKRLTGLHCVKTAEYFKVLTQKKLLQYKAKFLTTVLNEYLLYKIVADSFGIPSSIDEKSSTKLYRPYHGIHCSFHLKDWYMSMYCKEFLQFVSNDFVRGSFLPHYKPWYTQRLLATYKRYNSK